MNIDQLLTTVSDQQLTTATTNRVELTVDKSWSQGRTLFGGLSAGLAYQVCKPLVDDDRLLRSLNINFIGPLSYDIPFVTEATILRSGKNVTQLQAQIIQQDKVCLSALICFGVARKSKISVPNNDKHSMPAPKRSLYIPQIPKVTPRFLRHFDLCVIEGGIPFLNGKKSHYHGYMRFAKKQTPEKMTDVHLIMLIDAWPPTLIQMLKGPAPASSVSWQMEFIHPHSNVAGDAWYACQAHTRHAADGYGHTEANIWDDKGALIAMSRQTVAVFD